MTPSGNLGEAVKVSVLTEHVSQSRAVATILLYNVVSFTVELAMVAVAAPFIALLVPMPSSLRWVMLGAGVVCAVLAIGLYVLVRSGVLASVARLLADCTGSRDPQVGDRALLLRRAVERHESLDRGRRQDAGRPRARAARSLARHRRGRRCRG